MIKGASNIRVSQIRHCLFIGVAALLLIEGCSKHTGSSAVNKWTMDSAKVLRILPILTEVESCAWHEGILQDRSGGFVPGPSSHFIRGYAVISRANMESVATAYVWEVSKSKSSELDLPEGTVGQQLRGTLLESPGLVHSLPGISTYHKGRVLICPEDGFVYFDLVKD